MVASVYRIKGITLGDKLLRTLPLNSQNKQGNYDISKLKYSCLDRNVKSSQEIVSVNGISKVVNNI